MKIILASKSPRRRQLLSNAGFTFEARSKDIAENYPSTLSIQEVPSYLAQLKAEAFRPEIQDKELIITSDTVVIQGEEILGKPTDLEDAAQTLQRLSGKSHEVWSGVCLFSKDKTLNFSEKTTVFFEEITSSEIKYYLEIAPPLDKAGAYGIQDWIGLIGVKKIEGCYYNVMGLPVPRLYKELKKHFPEFSLGYV